MENKKKNGEGRRKIGSWGEGRRRKNDRRGRRRKNERREEEGRRRQRTEEEQRGKLAIEVL